MGWICRLLARRARRYRDRGAGGGEGGGAADSRPCGQRQAPELSPCTLRWRALVLRARAAAVPSATRGRNLSLFAAPFLSLRGRPASYIALSYCNAPFTLPGSAEQGSVNNDNGSGDDDDGSRRAGLRFAQLSSLRSPPVLSSLPRPSPRRQARKAVQTSTRIPKTRIPVSAIPYDQG